MAIIYIFFQMFSLSTRSVSSVLYFFSFSFKNFQNVLPRWRGVSLSLSFSLSKYTKIYCMMHTLLSNIINIQKYINLSAFVNDNLSLSLLQIWLSTFHFLSLFNIGVISSIFLSFYPAHFICIHVAGSLSFIFFFSNAQVPYAQPNKKERLMQPTSRLFCLAISNHVRLSLSLAPVMDRLGAIRLLLAPQIDPRTRGSQNCFSRPPIFFFFFLFAGHDAEVGSITKRRSEISFSPFAF